MSFFTKNRKKNLVKKLRKDLEDYKADPKDKSKEQVELINRSPVNVVYLMFDNDSAGRQFNRQLHRELSKKILIVDVNIVGKKDIGELTKEEFWYFINNAK